jgi:hypothetical protein
MLFSYFIVPTGSHGGQALIRGNLYISDADSAKQHVQTVAAPGLVGPDLDVILQDARGNEIWRGPYQGGSSTRRDT